MDIENVKGVGPKTATKLKAANINTAEDLAAQSEEVVTGLGIGKTTAAKIIIAAQEIAGVKETKTKTPKETIEKELVEEPQPVTDKPKKETKPKKEKVPVVEETPVDITEPVAEVKEEVKPKTEKKPKTKPKKERKTATVYEDEPITTKKKKGIQVRKIAESDTEDQIIDDDEASQRSTWKVTAKELSDEAQIKKAERAKLRSEADKITRPIPSPPEPVKAIKTSKKKKTEKPEKQIKEQKTVQKFEKSKKRRDIEYFTQRGIFEARGDNRTIKPRGIKGEAGEAKPRSLVAKGTELGYVASHRRSRRNIHNSQLILQLNEDFDSDSLIGKKIVFTYPDNEKHVVGTIYKRFAKKNSRKVLAKFDKGIRTEAKMAKVFAK
jgi:ribosomal protein L35AE/L33A